MRFIVLLLISYPALADFSGRWIGEGEALFNSGRKYHCSQIYLHLNNKPSLLQLHEGGYACSLLQASFDSFFMNIQNGKLYANGQEVGFIDNERLSYEIYDPSDNSTYKLQLKKLNDFELIYLEEWFDNGKIALTIRGQLLRLSIVSKPDDLNLAGNISHQ